MRAGGWILFLAGAALLSGCARVNYAPAPPPPERHEALPPSPGEGWAWIPGHWDWTGRRYAWTPGRWDERREGEWAAGRWENSPRGWVYLPGHWR